MDWARDYWIEEDVQQNANLTGAKNNPYFVAYECLNTLDRDRVFGNTSLDLHLYQGLDLMLRGGVDFSRDHRTMQQPKSSYSQRYGMYREGDVSSLQMSLDFLLKYSRKLGAGFEMKLNFGGSIINRMFRETTKTAEQLKQPGVYSLANSVERVKTQTYDYERQTNSLYGLAQFSWRDAIFLDITGRNDWSSTLPINNNSYFYPSVSTSILLNELIDFGSLRNTFNLVKLRGSRLLPLAERIARGEFCEHSARKMIGAVDERGNIRARRRVDGDLFEPALHERGIHEDLRQEHSLFPRARRNGNDVVPIVGMPRIRVEAVGAGPLDKRAHAERRARRGKGAPLFGACPLLVFCRLPAPRIPGVARRPRMVQCHADGKPIFIRVRPAR